MRLRLAGTIVRCCLREGFNCPKGMELSMASFLAAMPPTAILRADTVLLSVLLKTRIELRNNLAFCIDS